MYGIFAGVRGEQRGGQRGGARGSRRIRARALAELGRRAGAAAGAPLRRLQTHRELARLTSQECCHSTGMVSLTFITGT